MPLDCASDRPSRESSGGEDARSLTSIEDLVGDKVSFWWPYVDDRLAGPDSHAYMRALASCARASADMMNNSAERDEWHRFISDFEVLAPHLLPSDTPCTIWHPDCHAGNIIVSEPTKPCTFRGIIDWQAATVLPYILGVEKPDAYVPTEHPLIHLDASNEDRPTFRPDIDLNKITREEKHQAELTIRSIQRSIAYKRWLREVDSDLFEAFWGVKDTYTMRLATSPLDSITRVDFQGLEDAQLAFRCSHMAWPMLAGIEKGGRPRKPWPLLVPDYDPQDIMSGLAEDGPGEAICSDVLRSFGLIPSVDAPIPVDKFQEVKEALDKAKQEALDDLPQEAKEAFEAEWPIQDGKMGMGTEVCY